MSARPFPLESKACAVKAGIAAAPYWHPRVAREFAVQNWKGRKGNLTGRPHPRDKVSCDAWRSITAARLRRREERNAQMLGRFA